MLNTQLPGIRFESHPQQIKDELPRMDIAAFVGFASNGPLNLPVAVDSVVRYREIFGVDPALAWDPEAKEMRYGFLGSSVESFFANGGRRCWIVRVADQEHIVHHRFTLSGLVSISDSNDPLNSQEQPFVRARAPGSWIEPFSVGMRLQRDLIALREFSQGNQDSIDQAPIRLDSNQTYVDVIAHPSFFEPGELIEILFNEDLPRLWFFIDNIEAQEGFIRLNANSATPGTPESNIFWVEPHPSAEQSRLQLLDPEAALNQLELAGVFADLTNWQSIGLVNLVSVRRLRLEFLVWDGGLLINRLSDLGMSLNHPRFWAKLPSDTVLFTSPSLSRPQREATALDAVISSPRFPLAGPSDDLDYVYNYHLPLNIDSEVNPNAANSISNPNNVAQSISPETLGDSRLQRDGLASYNAGLFIDAALAPLRNNVMSEALNLYYYERQNLSGFHALLPITEISLIGVPDASHPGWTRQSPPAARLISSPLLLPIQNSVPPLNTVLKNDLKTYIISWTPVEDATLYTLEIGNNSDFNLVQKIYSGVDTEFTLQLSDPCPQRYFFRVRAHSYDQLSPWSNSREALLPGPEFAQCSESLPAELYLTLTTTDDSPSVPAFLWQVDSEESPGQEGQPWYSNANAEIYEFQFATDANFVGATSLFVSALSLSLDDLHSHTEIQSARHFFRVRGISGDQIGPFSNTELMDPVQRVDWTLIPHSEFDDSALIAVQRALLRFCAGRADIMAILTMPKHYLSNQASSHVSRLAAGAAEQLHGNLQSARVPPLSYAEQNVLRFGAMFHPWLTLRVSDRDSTLASVTTSLPADGSVIGSMAALAIERGAWLAPANRVMQRILALQPPMDVNQWQQLIPARVNLALRSPQGFIFFSESTLDAQSPPEPIHVRRLMIMLRRLVSREGQRFVFQVNDDNLQNFIRHRFETIFARLYSLGAFAGNNPSESYRIANDVSINPPSSVESGKCIVEIRVAPAEALEFITVRLISDERGRLALEEL